MTISELKFKRIKIYLETPKFIEVYPTIQEVSDRFGCSTSTISKIKNSPNYDFFKNYETTAILKRLISKENDIIKKGG